MVFYIWRLSMLRKIGYLTEEQFAVAVLRSRLSPKGRQAAQRVLVGKETQASVSKDIGVSREKVRQYCHAVYRQFADLAQCPKGWVGTSVCLPNVLVGKLSSIERVLRVRQTSSNDVLSDDLVLQIARKSLGKEE